MFGLKLKNWKALGVFLFLFVFLGTEVFSHASGTVEECSFGVFRSQYGDMFDVRYWQNQLDDNYYFHTGLYDDAINFAWAANFLGIYWGAGYNAKIMNHKAWPHNLTDMDVCIMAGIPSLGLGVRASYYDQNVYKGLGTAAPKVEIGKTFESVPIKLGFEAEGKFRYWKSLCLDVAQIPFILKLDFSPDGMRGVGGTYTVMPTLKYPSAVNEVSGLAPMQGFSFWAGWKWNILDNLKFGLRPSFMMNFNCVNTADNSVNKRISEREEDGVGRVVENTSWIPENGNTEWRVSVPFSALYDVTENVQFIVGFKCGFYWANFDHMSEMHSGGRNLHGTVNETGFALGVKAEMNENAVFQIGASYTRQLSLNPEGNTTGSPKDYETDAPNVSLSNLFDQPVTASLTLRF